MSNSTVWKGYGYQRTQMALFILHGSPVLYLGALCPPLVDCIAHATAAVYPHRIPSGGLASLPYCFPLANNEHRWPVSEVFIMEQTSSRYRSTPVGVSYFTMYYTGAIFAPVMGTIID